MRYSASFYGLYQISRYQNSEISVIDKHGTTLRFMSDIPSNKILFPDFISEIFMIK